MLCRSIDEYSDYRFNCREGHLPICHLVWVVGYLLLSQRSNFRVITQAPLRNKIVNHTEKPCIGVETFRDKLLKVLDSDRCPITVEPYCKSGISGGGGFSPVKV